MAKELSTHAAAAKALRAEIKKLGITGAKVKSSIYAGGSSIYVEVGDVAPEPYRKLKEIAQKYQQGSYNSMEDYYDYSNTNDNLPQVKYVNCSNHFTDELLDLGIQTLGRLPNDGLGLGMVPEKFSEATCKQKEYTMEILRGQDSMHFFSKHLWTNEQLGMMGKAA